MLETKYSSERKRCLIEKYIFKTIGRILWYLLIRTFLELFFATLNVKKSNLQKRKNWGLDFYDNLYML